MERVVGADVARGLAVLGMFTAHLGSADPDFWRGDGWLQVADGRSAATFALLAGLSAALLSGGPVPRSGAALTHARVRVLVRAVLLWPLGALLVALGTPVAVILPGYAVMFGLTAGVLAWRPRSLLVTAAVVVTLGPPLALLARRALGDGSLPQPLDVLVGEHYPAVVWTAYLLVGVAVGRTDLRAPGAPVRLVLLGLPALVLGYGTSAVAVRVLEPGSTLHALLTAEPHADTATEVVGNVGVSLLVLAGSLALARSVPRLVAPVAATGALALTAYCTHVAAIAVLGDDVVWGPSNADLVAFVVVTLVLATAWRSLLGRGPLERLLHVVSTAVADALAPEGRRPVADREDVRPGPAAPRGAR